MNDERVQKTLRILALGAAVGLVALLVLTTDIAAQTVTQISDAAGLTSKAKRPAVAYNSTDDEFLVVYEQTTATDSVEIVGQLLQFDGQKIGTPFQISSNGNFGARRPAVSYHAANNTYLVVWEGDVTSPDQYELWGAYLSAAGGDLLGVFPVALQSEFGADELRSPAVAYDSVTSTFLVVWEANMSATVGDVRVYGRYVEVLAGPTINQGSINQMSHPLAAPPLSAFAPAVAFDSQNQQFMVTWTSDIGGNQHEVFGAYTSFASQPAAGEIQISEMANAGANRDAFDSHVAYDADNKRLMTVWTGDGGTLASETYETFGQINEDSLGVTLTADDFQISSASATAADRDAYHPHAIYSANDFAYLVFAESDGGALAAGTYETFIQRVDTTGTLSSNFLQLSRMSDAGAGRDGRLPTAVQGSVSGQTLVAWNGDGETQTDNDDEVFGFVDPLTLVPVFFGFVGADVAADGVSLTWQLEADEAIAGFNIHRWQAGAREQQINGALLPSDTRYYDDATALSGETYHYVVTAVLPDGSDLRSAPVTVSLRPTRFGLSQNFPNPFNPSTSIQFDLEAPSHVLLTIYDVAGRRIVDVVNEQRTAGTHTVLWNGRNAAGNEVASGTYLYRIVAQSANGSRFIQRRKLVLTR